MAVADGPHPPAGLGTVIVVEVDPTDAEARRCLAAYAAELDRRFDEGFDPATLVAPEEVRGPRGAFLVAQADGRSIGCIALRALHENVGEIRHLWIDPAARGMGLARRLLGALEVEAARRGCTVVRLDTHRSLAEAIGLYRSAGYREITPYNDNPYAAHWFEKDLDRPA
jgi:ribosomal protein S18 acetylase RimI-like enzyme